MKPTLLTIIKEPLLHFALLGTLLFALSAYLNPAAQGPEQVLISTQKVQHLTTIFDKKWRRSPSAAELSKIVDDYILEEIYYREAIAMQMDRDDTVIRRRLRQKMEFLMIDVSRAMTPDDSQLQAFLDQHPDDFVLEARYSFRQIYLDPNKHDNVDQAIATIKDQLANGQTPTGDATMLPKSFTNSPASRVNAALGETFITELSQLSLNAKMGQWQGPIRSGYGLHWVNLSHTQAPRHPQLQAVYDQVLREWRYDLQQQTAAQVDRQLLDKYQVQVDWPVANEQQPGQQDGQQQTTRIDPKDSRVKTDG